MKKYINLPELNFILTFAGFALFTTFIQNSTTSVVYRAFALIIALLCIYDKNGRRNIKRVRGNMMIVFMVLYIFIVIGCVWDLYFGYYYGTHFVSSRRLALSFVLGVTFFPVLAFYLNIERIRWENVLTALFWMLFFVLGLGQLRGVTDDISGRGSLNTHMTTLGLAEMGVYLTLVSAALTGYSEKAQKSRWYKYFFIFGILLGLASIARAASRGPFVGVLVALLYFLFVGKKTTKFYAVLAVIGLLLVGFSADALLERYAPVLYGRMVYTIEEQDTGGRDILFDEAIKNIKENPVTGGTSIVLSENAISSCHNLYLDTALETGVLGGVVFILISIILLLWSLLSAHIRSLPLVFFSSLFIFNLIRGMSGLSLSTCPIVVIGYMGLIWCRDNISRIKQMSNY